MVLDAFLDGLTGAGLFGKLRWPGAPTEFIDSRSSLEFDAQEAAASMKLQLVHTGAPVRQKTRGHVDVGSIR